MNRRIRLGKEQFSSWTFITGWIGVLLPHPALISSKGLCIRCRSSLCCLGGTYGCRWYKLVGPSSQNHRQPKVGRDLMMICCKPLLEQGQPEQVAQDHIQSDFACLQRWRLHSFSGQPSNKDQRPDIRIECSGTFNLHGKLLNTFIFTYYLIYYYLLLFYFLLNYYYLLLLF